MLIEDFILFLKQCCHIIWNVEKIESKNPSIVKTKNGRIILLSKCAVCDSKKSKFIKEQELTGY